MTFGVDRVSVMMVYVSFLFFFGVSVLEEVEGEWFVKMKMERRERAANLLYQSQNTSQYAVTLCRVYGSSLSLIADKFSCKVVAQSCGVCIGAFSPRPRLDKLTSEHHFANENHHLSHWMGG